MSGWVIATASAGLALLLCSVLDAVWLVTRGGSALEAAAALGTGVLVTLLLGPALGALEAAMVRATMRASERRAVRVGLGALLPGVGYTALWWALVRDRWPRWDLAKRLVGVGGLAGSWIVVALVVTGVVVLLPRARGSRAGRAGVAAALLGAATLAHVADRSVLVDLYPRLHDGLLATAILSGQVGWLALLPPVRVPARLLGVAALGLAVGSALVTPLLWRLDEHPRVALALLGDTGVARRLILGARAATDRDGDGYSPYFGGGDCDDATPERHPGRFDLPDNGIDEDCSGRDSSAAEFALDTPTIAPPVTGRFNVLLLTIDALRADHLGFLGYHRPTSPNMDRLAAQSVVFARAYAQGNGTATSLPSLLTGRYASSSPWTYTHRDPIRPNWPRLVDEDNVTLAELLRDSGYRTGAAVAGDFLHNVRLDQGFETRHEGLFEGVALFDEFMAAASDDRPWLFWLHLADPHKPYHRDPRFDFGSEEIDRYDSEIARADEQVGAVLNVVETAGMAARTIVVLGADHGEAFREHGQNEHASSLYDEQIRVPLVLRVPGLPHRFSSRPAENAGITPTLLSILGIDAPVPMDGRSLFALLTEPPVGPVFAYAEHYFGFLAMHTLIEERYKLISDRVHSTAMLFDLIADPTEHENLVESHPRVLEQMQARLAAVTLRRTVRMIHDARSGGRTARVQLARSLPAIEDPGLREDAFRTLERLRSEGPAAEIARVARGRRVSRETRLRAVDALAAMGGDSAARHLRKLATWRDPVVARRARAHEAR